MTTKEDIWLILSDLTDEQFKTFKWLLKTPGGSVTAIPAARLENADRQDTVDLMVQKHGTITEAVQKTTTILETIPRNDLVQRLSNTRTGQRNIKNIDSGQSKRELERQKAKLGGIKTKTKLMIQERETKMGEIQHSAELSRKSAERQISDIKNAFTTLIESIQRSMASLTDEIQKKQKTTEKQADGIIQELKQEISELIKSEAELQKLLLAEDNLSYIQSSSNKNWTEVTVPQPSYEESVTTTVSELKEILNKEMEMLLSKAKLNRLKQFAVNVTLDPNTAHPNLVLSEDRKQVYCSNNKKNLPDNPERYNTAPNVLGLQSFSSGRFYFEVQVKGKTAWDLGVVKESISRKGSINAKPNDGYWAICLRMKGEYKASGVHLGVKPPLNKVGVFVDYEMGLISFYNVDSAELIHNFTDFLFKEKLYPFFSPSIAHDGLNITPLVISKIT